MHTYEAIETLAQARNDRRLELTALAERAKIYSTMTPKQNPERGQAPSDQALALARELDDKAAEAKILWHLALLHLWGGGTLRQSVQYGEQALALARQLQLPKLMAFIMSDLSQAMIKTGQLDRAGRLLIECRQLDDGSIDFAFESWFTEPKVVLAAIRETVAQVTGG